MRFVGDPVACVVAETLAQAKDAAEAVLLEIDPLPAVTLASEAARAGAPLLYDDVPGNVALDYHYGDSEKVAAAFAAGRACHQAQAAQHPAGGRRDGAARGDRRATTRRASIGRCIRKARACSGMKGSLVDLLKTTPDKVRVLTGNVGGSFGMKAAVYPEYVCILHAARMLGRPVKWTDERSGSFVSDHHGRDHEVEAELALDKDGNFLAVRLTSYGNMGAFLGTVAPLMPTLNAVKNVASVYKTPLLEVSTKCVFTNTSHVSAYRGAGRPEGNYYMERLIDEAAVRDGHRPHRAAPAQSRQAVADAVCGLIRHELRQRRFPAVFKAAIEAADIKGFNARKRESKKRGKLRGLGIGSYLEVTAPPNKEMGGITFEKDGTVTITTGTLDYGQGHATPYAQVLTEKLGVPFDKIRLHQNDSDDLIAGGGTGGSRSITASGAAIVEASAKVIEQGKAIASHVLEAAPGDIDFANGRFVITGTDRAIGIMELAEKIRSGANLPKDGPQSLDVRHATEAIPSAFPNGCHVAEVEIDPLTGDIDVVKYSSVNDFGTIVNPLLVEGQVHGGVVQGLGQALMENAVYDDEGQLLAGSFMDYAMPRASNAPPEIGFISHPVPAKSNPLGTKGCGEAGCAGALVCVMNAIVDALSVYGIRHIDMPVTPAKVWAAIQAAKGGV